MASPKTNMETLEDTQPRGVAFATRQLSVVFSKEYDLSLLGHRIHLRPRYRLEDYLQSKARPALRKSHLLRPSDIVMTSRSKRPSSGRVGRSKGDILCNSCNKHIMGPSSVFGRSEALGRVFDGC